MKKNKLILTTLFGLLFLVSSCDDFLNVNTDPNNPTEVTPDLVLPVGLNYTANYVQGDRRLNHLGNMLMYNYGEAAGFSWYDEEFQYLVSTTFYSALFDEAYSSALKQYDILADMSDEEYGYYNAIGKIMKAYHFQILVDLYGDIPYSEALARGENPTPAYDDAEVIYDDLLVQLSDAISLIDDTEATGTAVPVGDDDTIYGGDMDSWKQFANTIKVRILTRLSDVKGNQFITDQLNTIANEGSGYISDDVGINPGFVNEEDKQNPLWADFGWDVSGTATLTNDATAATQYVIDYLAGSNDPRISLIYEQPETGHKGVDQGADNSDAAETGPDVVSNIGPGILKGFDMDATILTLAEHNFNLAELAQKGFSVGDDAQTFYEAGVLASMNFLAPDSAGTPNEDKVDAYLAQNSQNRGWDGSSNKLEAIITQKWIATNGVTAEQSWFDYSRTGYPANLPVSMDASTNDRPTRLIYPSSEITTNGENVPSQSQSDGFDNNIFWAN